MIKPVGIHLDNQPLEQPDNTARFALNAVLDTDEGDMYNYSTEKANQLSFNLKPNYTLVGSIKLDGNNVCLFSTDGTTSEIGLFNKGIYETLVSSQCLNFSEYIKGKYRIIRGCERIIYFVDGVNPDKAINIDRLSDYNRDGEFDCNLARLNPDYIIPEVEVVSVSNSGGRLEAGSYAFAIELADSSLNTIAVGTITNFIPIYNDRLSDTYDSIHGSLTDINPSVEGGTSVTSKSITLNLNNLDTRYDFARVIVIAKNTGRGLAEEAYELDYLPISDNQLVFTLTNLDDSARTDVEQVRVKSVKYTTSTAIDIVDSRLVRANLTEQARDYSGYQRVANTIQTRYQLYSEIPQDITEDHNTKNPLSYELGNSWLPDEIYALGIEYIHNDGTISPVFHIPGRTATAYDLQQITIDVENSRHLGTTTPQRWQYENTASLPSALLQSKELGYFQTDTTYPDIQDCEGLPIYGELANTPIRHHRIPCRRDIAMFNNQEVVKIKLVFDNLEYPDSSIVGHRFVKAIRRESDKTVVDTGIKFFDNRLAPPSLADAANNYVFNILTPTTSTDAITAAIISPKILANNNVDFDYIKYLNVERVETTASEQGENNNLTVNVVQLEGTNDRLQFQGLYRSINRRKLIAPNSQFDGDFNQPIINKSFSNSIMAIELTDTRPAVNGQFNNGVFYVMLKRSITPYRNLYQLQYEPITKNLTLDTIQESYQGSAFPSLFNVFNISSIREGFGSFLVSADQLIAAQYLTNLYIDTDVNYELRVEGTSCNSIYSSNQDLLRYTFSKIADLDGTTWKLKGTTCREYYRYNQDYEVASGETPRLPIPFNFDFCSSCISKFPNRIVWSPKSFAEQVTDNFRINLVNDFLTLGEAKGQINNIHYDKNRMLVWTNDSVFLLTPNPRVINTDVDTAYIGSGEFLGVPAIEFSQVDHGFGGCQSRTALVNTENGVVWADQQAGRIYAFDGGIKEITEGVYTWMRDKLLNGRLLMHYDPYYKRVIFSNRFIAKDVNLSWTLSYSTKYANWSSFHTWHPDWMFSDRDTFYSSLADGVYTHDTNNYLTFYGIPSKFMVEYVDKAMLTSDLDVIQYYASPSDYPTFNEFVVYNNNQSTGLQRLIEKTDYYPTWSNEQKVVANTQDDYRISQLRNLNVSKPTTTSEWSTLQSEYSDSQGYIDKLPANIDYNMNQWKLEPMRHKYFQVRLIYKGDERIVFHISQTLKRHKEL